MSAYDNTKALFDSLNKMFPPSPLNSTDMNFGPSPENTATEPKWSKHKISEECWKDRHEDCDDFTGCRCECHQSEADMQRIYDSREFNS